MIDQNKPTYRITDTLKENYIICSSKGPLIELQHCEPTVCFRGFFCFHSYFVLIEKDGTLEIFKSNRRWDGRKPHSLSEAIFIIVLLDPLKISVAASLRHLLDNQEEILRLLRTQRVGVTDDPANDPEEVIRAKLDGPCVTLEAFLKLENEATGDSRFRAELVSN